MGISISGAMPYRVPINTSKQIEEEERTVSTNEETLPSKEDFKRYEFHESAGEIFEAILNKKKIGGIDIMQEVKNPDFRFTSAVEPELVSVVSDLIAAVLKELYLGNITKARQQRAVDADNYARRIYPVITELQNQENIHSFRKTVKLLTERDIPTPNGGKWSTNTLQDLYSRCRKLGLIQESIKPL